MAKQNKLRSAFGCAIDLLALREHFSNELALKLRLRGYAVAEINEALELAREANYLSDERACESFVRLRMERGYGRHKILAELYEREVSQSLIECFLPRECEVWRHALIALCHKRFDLTVGDSLNLKQLRFLLHRGFELNVIKALFRLDLE